MKPAALAEAVRLILDTPRSYNDDEHYGLGGVVATGFGDTAEKIRLLSRSRLVDLLQAAVLSLSTGERIAFLDIFSGEGLLTLGVRAHGLKAIDGWDRLSPFGSKKRDFRIQLIKLKAVN